MLDDPLSNPEHIIGRVVFSIVKTGPDTTGVNVQFEGLDEITALGLIEKGKQVLLAMSARQQIEAMQKSQPHIIPANGAVSPSLRRQLGIS